MGSPTRSRFLFRITVLAIGVAILTTLVACDPLMIGVSGTSSTLQDASVLGWPFDVHAGSWAIENGYNTDPDHHGYELDSFDLQRQDTTTTGQSVLSPATGDVIDIGSAFPGDYTSGHCARVSVTGYAGYYVMVCHLVSVTAGQVNRGDPIGTVAGGPNGNHIHITLYYLPPGTLDTTAYAADRMAVPFSAPWTIAGCSFPATGAANEWAGAAVPCGASSGIPIATPVIVPTATSVDVPLSACASLTGFATAGSAASLASDFMNSEPRVPAPPQSVGYIQKVFDDPAVGEPGMVYHYELISVCSPAITPAGVRSFFATQMPQTDNWFQSDTFPYSGDYSRACGDPYCWAWGPYAGDISRFASLESVKQAGLVTIYQLRLSYESPQ